LVYLRIPITSNVWRGLRDGKGLDYLNIAGDDGDDNSIPINRLYCKLGVKIMGRIIFNFFDRESTFKALCDHFNIVNGEQVLRYLTDTDWDSHDYIEFVKDFNIHFEQLEVDNVFITCKHITTYHDNGEALRKYGLLNLKEALEKDTPLKAFLAEHKINIDVNNRKFIYDGNQYPLFNWDEKCPICLNETPIQGTSTHCTQKYHESIKLLYNKLYHDKCETEVFIGSYRNSIEDYPCVKNHPEILLNIDNIVKAIGGTAELSKEWEKLQGGTYYILEFDVNIKAFEGINKVERYENYKDYCAFLGYECDSCGSNIPQKILYNIFLIENSIKVIADRDKEEFGQILPTEKIAYDELRITKHTVDINQDT
jgi:hypothetical protein